MTAKEYLRQYEYAAKRVKRLEEEYNTEREQIDAVRSVSDNDGMPHGNGISKPTEEKAIRLADKLQELADARLDAVEIIMAIEEKQTNTTRIRKREANATAMMCMVSTTAE